MSTPLLSPETREFVARALLVGQRIDLRALGSTQRLGGGPLVLTVRGGGVAILFRILERYTALNRKLELVSRTVETALGLLQARRSLRVEWYIVILIVFEILLTLYQLIFLGGH